MRLSGFLALLLLLVALAFWCFGWSSPAHYQPSFGPQAAVSPLDSAGHDARVSQLGPDDPYILHLQASGPESPSPAGSLLYFGSLHTNDPGHPQISQLQAAWNAFQPTVALVEGRMGLFIGTAYQGVKVFGEGAIVYSLAEDADIPLYTLEPPLETEVDSLRTVGDDTQIALFLTLRGYISARRGGPVSDFKIRRLLAKRAAPLTDSLPDIPALDAYFKTQFPTLGDWRQLPEEALWPGRFDTWLNLMASQSNVARDDHCVRVLLDLVRQGHRVLAVSGRSHTIILEPLLVESLQPAQYGSLSSPRPWETMH